LKNSQCALPTSSKHALVTEPCPSDYVKPRARNLRRHDNRFCAHDVRPNTEE
jgi:hypothetical protein